MFKVGDKILCVDNSGLELELEKNKTYTVKYVTSYMTLYNGMIYGIIIDENVARYSNNYKIERFSYDIKSIRKDKLSKINKNSNTKKYGIF